MIHMGKCWAWILKKDEKNLQKGKKVSKKCWQSSLEYSKIPMSHSEEGRQEP